MREIVKSEQFNKYACTGVLHSARKLSPNTEKSSVLLAVAETQWVSDPEIRETFVAVAKTLSSDSEYRRVVDRLIEYHR